jgi:hypothetical protein
MRKTKKEPDICFAVEDSKLPASKQKRVSPENREIALSFQLHSDLRVCYAMAHISPESFENALRSIEQQVAVYRQMRAADRRSKTKQDKPYRLQPEKAAN